MKISIERGALLKAVGQAQSVVERRNTIPILANVLIEAEGGHVSFRATDLDIEVVDKAPAMVERPGATTVSAGTLLVNGSLSNTAVSVAAAATIAGTGSLGGTLALDGASFLEVKDFSDALTVAGTITFGTGFGISNLTGIDWSSLNLNAPYTVISTTQTFSASDIGNFGIGNAASVGDGRFAYFDNGSLAVVVIPEPTSALLGGLGALMLLRRRRI